MKPVAAKWRASGTLAYRRMRNMLWLLVACGVLWLADVVVRHQLYQGSFFSGWILAAVVLLLLLFGVRKKLPVLPLGRVAGWMQWHIYMGLFSVFVFWLHARSWLPEGIFEGVLMAVFLLVALSGVVGLLLSRITPERLTRRGEALLFERLDGFRTQLASEAEALIEQAQAEHGSRALRKFYLQWLRPFFAAPQNYWAHTIESRVPAHRLASRFTALQRYLNEDERAIVEQLMLLVEKKHEIDYHYARQSLLKRWLFVHIPLSVALLALVPAHIVIVYAFGGPH